MNDTSRRDALQDIAQQAETMARQYGRRDDIRVIFDRPTDETIKKYADFQQRYYGIIPGEEYFTIYETGENKNFLLYTVTITGDSLLTAAAELMNLLARKF